MDPNTRKNMFSKLTKVSATHGGPAVTSTIAARAAAANSGDQSGPASNSSSPGHYPSGKGALQRRESALSISSVTGLSLASSSPSTSSPSGSSLIDSNPISSYFEVNPRQVASAGPELAWKIFPAIRKSDKKEASIFFFDKRVADKIHKPKRRETISEILRFSGKQLDRYRHPRILQLTHSVEETSDTIAFATEPVLGSLANILGYLEERLPQNIPPEIRSYLFIDFEIKYGILQISEALQYLHTSCKIIHRNICPQSVIVTKKGTWKLAGFEFLEKSNDHLNPVQCQGWTSKLPKMAQPDLDFTAPETMSSFSCSPQSDMFSFGLLIYSLFNHGKSPLESNLSPQNYMKQLDLLCRNVNEMLMNKVDSTFHEALQSLLQLDPRARPTSQLFSTSKFLMDPGVHALQVLDVIHMKDSTHKMTFYHNLPQVMADIPKKMWYQHMLPSMEADLSGSEVMGAALQPVFYMIEEASEEDFKQILFPLVHQLINIPRSVQATVTLLENMDILVRKATIDQLKNELLPMLFTSLDSSTPQIQNAALHAVMIVIDGLDEETIRKTIIPKTKQVFENNPSVQVQGNTLSCIERIIENLEKTDVLDHVLPMLLTAKLGESLVLMPIIRIYKRMLDDKRYGLTIGILATKVLPSLTPAIVSPNLRLDEFNCLVETIQEMLEHVSRNQRNKLKLERLSIGSIDSPSMQLRRSNDSPIGYPHRPPGLRLENRRTSISIDDVARRGMNSGASSPDSNLLRVQANLPGRRHSDNTIQMPRIQVNSQSPPSTGYSRRSSAGNLWAGGRRHSAGPNVGTYSPFGPAGPSFVGSGFTGFGYKGLSGGQGSTTGFGNNIDFVIPSYQRASPTPTSRRFSAAPSFGPSPPPLGHKHTLPQIPTQSIPQIGLNDMTGQQGQAQIPGSSILQQIGSGMQQFFGK